MTTWKQRRPSPTAPWLAVVDAVETLPLDPIHVVDHEQLEALGGGVDAGVKLHAIALPPENHRTRSKGAERGQK